MEKINSELSPIFLEKIGKKVANDAVMDVWHKINGWKEQYYTNEAGKTAHVKAVSAKDGRRYLTTHPDGVTDNNLDELKSCW